MKSVPLCVSYNFTDSLKVCLGNTEVHDSSNFVYQSLLCRQVFILVKVCLGKKGNGKLKKMSRIK